MCGIIGYVGSQNAVDVLVMGLSKLEYRGYDSAGIAVLENKHIELIKTVGRVKALNPLLTQLEKDHYTCGIGHTRWATHGIADTLNAHPHTQGKVTLVHNGILENYQYLKEKANDGFFKSQTDTEVIAYYINKFYHRYHDPLKAIQMATKLFKGSYALCILFDDINDTLFVVRVGSPLLIGKNNEGYIVSSDINSINESIDDYYILDEQEIGVVKTKSINFYDLDSFNTVSKLLHPVTIQHQSDSLGNFKHYMIKEITEQPVVLKRTIEAYVENTSPSFKKVGIPTSFFDSIETIHIVGCGTAYYAGLVGKYWLEDSAKVRTYSYIASEFRYHPPIFHKNDLVIFMSQSGETADTLACLELVKKRHIKTLGIVNVETSRLAQEVDYTLLTYAGVEVSVASTKAYMTQIGVLYVLKQFLSNSTIDMNDVFLGLEDIITRQEEIYKIAQMYAHINDAFFIGRGLDYATSEEGSLKLKEVSYIHSEAYPAGELKHGTISLIDHNILSVAIITQSSLLKKTMSNVEEIRAREGDVFTISQFDIVDQNSYDAHFHLPNIKEEQAPFLSVVVVQLFAYYMATLKGNDVDRPRNLAKSVTVE